MSSRVRIALLTGVLALAGPIGLHAAPLSPRTIVAFEQYERATEARMDQARAGGAFLWMDSLAADRRAKVLAELQRGQVVIASLRTEEAGKAMSVPDGMLLHSVGAIFLRGATLDRVTAILRDYNSHGTLYFPGVRKSRLVRHDGDDDIVERQLARKKIITVVLNATFVEHYAVRGPRQVECRGRTTRIAEVAEAGKPTEHEKPASPDRHRLHTYYRVEARDGGVYMEYETLYVGPQLSIWIRWFANALVNSVPGEMETDILQLTRQAVAGPARAGG